MPVPVNWFKDWFNSTYHPLLYFEQNAQEAAAFIDRLTTHLSIPAGATLLDAACQRGQFSKQLAGKGFDVTGIDAGSENMHAALQIKLPNLQFFQHDLRLPFWINYFEYVFHLFNPFGYCKSEREDQNIIRTLAQSLKPNGLLVLDFLNVHFAEDHLIYNEEKKINDITFNITRWLDETHFYKKIIVEDERNEAPLEFFEKIAKYSLGDFNDTFAFNGLQLQHVYGDYNFTTYDVKHSPRLLMIAKKM